MMTRTGLIVVAGALAIAIWLTPFVAEAQGQKGRKCRWDIGFPVCRNDRIVRIFSIRLEGA